jgi:hypothetical protein
MDAETGKIPGRFCHDPIFPTLDDWLHRIAGQCQGEVITDDDGGLWDVIATVSEFLHANWSEAWLDSIAPFYNAVVRAKPEWGEAGKQRRRGMSDGPAGPSE